MIRYQEMVPDWYIEKSRDFQILCRMYDFVVNSAKYNIDSMSNLTDTRRVKDTVLPLLGDKLGIYDKEAYSNRQMLEALPIAIKYKGSLKSVNILLNAFLDSMDVFDTVIALYAKDKETAEEIGSMLNKTINPYSIVIIFSTFPSLTNLHVLDEYLKMVMPTGLLAEYTFGVRKQYLDKFKYKEYTFLYFTGIREYEDKPMKIPMIGMLKNRSESYGTTFEYAGTNNIRTRKDFVADEYGQYVVELKHTAVPVPPSTEVFVYKVYVDSRTGNRALKERILPAADGKYHVDVDRNDVVCYLEYSFNKTKEFVDKLNADGFDVNAVSIGTIMSKDQIENE